MNDNIPANIDLDNAEFQAAWRLLQDTRKSVFLTGKAGSGKSTFLKYIRKHTKKKNIVLAPTGISAVNVGGQTLHSFFKIPFKPLLPDDPDFSPRKIRQTLRYSKDKVKIIKELELIIIDEISMVRADIIDFIDKVLRIYCANQREPFGGKQLLFVGDVFQLEPVVTRDMREILRRFYNQFFFFNAHVFGDLGLVPIELRKMYRQTDNTFLTLLDRVRNNHVSPIDIAQLNQRYNPNYNDNGEFVITLAMRRDTVDAINDEHMRALKTPEFTFAGEVSGTYPDSELPTSKDLVVKEGAQIIFIRNDKENRWVNGTLAKVSEVCNDYLKVEMEDGQIHELEREVWENMQYSFDEKENKITEKVLGSFSQYPIKPAWALTVHKSQGLTFNHVVIDFGGGAFTSGQTYVALSRCTSLEGITLLKPLSERDIIVNTAVITFSHRFNDQFLIENALRQERSRTLYRKSIHAFDHGEFSDAVKCFVEAMAIDDVSKSPSVHRLISQKLYRFKKLDDQIHSLEKVIDAQNKLMRQLAAEYTEMGTQTLGYGDLVGEEEVPYGGKTRIDEIAFKSANANFDKAIRICPAYTEAYVGKAHLLHTIGEAEEAEKLYQKALEAVPDSFEVHMALGSLYRDMKKVKEAITSYKRAIKADKTSPLPYEAMASIYENIGLEEQAELAQEKAKKLRKAKAKQRKKKK
ncbi:MAG: AAA family ATPase [Bacteroidales bacterium]|nr:AAA family ATPase [Bacteroidales bacterium]